MSRKLTKAELDAVREACARLDAGDLDQEDDADESRERAALARAIPKLSAAAAINSHFAKLLSEARHELWEFCALSDRKEVAGNPSLQIIDKLVSRIDVALKKYQSDV